jgi:hypothetical protein
MQAEVLGVGTRFEIQPARREDGTVGPPDRMSISVRPCWKKPAVRLELAYLYEYQGVAYYAVEGDSRS